MPINELRSIAAFAKTAELGSLRQAAAAQGMTPQAASQALAHLEKHLGMRLFHRTTRSMSLTAEGRQFLEAVLPSLGGLQRALEVSRRSTDDLAGPLRIAGPRSTLQPVLLPLLQEFCAAHPEVQPDVQLDDRVGNWVEDRVDVGFRIGQSPADGVVARRLFPLQLVICAAPAYLVRHGAPDSLDQLSAHRCVVFRQSSTAKLMPWKVKVGDGIVSQHVTPSLSTNEEDLETHAVVSGQAIGLLSGTVAAAHIRSGALVPLLTDTVAEPAGVFIYYGSRTAQPARVRAFVDLAIARLADAPAFVLSARELAAAEAKGRRRHRRDPAG